MPHIIYYKSLHEWLTTIIIAIGKKELYVHGQTGKETEFIGIQDSFLVYYNV